MTQAKKPAKTIRPKAVRPLAAGNWKMNGTGAELGEFRKLVKALSGKKRYDCDVMICPPATLLSRLAAEKAGRLVKLGGQDCHANASGAHTGDISAAMLKEAGATAVILGHSERRAEVKHGGYAESDKQVRAKLAAAHAAGLTAIVCVGERLKQRRAGQTLKIVGAQLRGSLSDGCTAKNTIIAYEPVWAIGSGLTPTPEQVAEVHKAMRRNLARRFGAAGEAMRLLYGGSVKPDNADELMGVANVNGALVGGASLKAADFMGIVKSWQK